MKYILRLDNGTVESGERCRDEERYQYVKNYYGKIVEFAVNAKDIKLIDEEVAKKGIYIAGGGKWKWEFIPIDRARKLKGLENL